MTIIASALDMNSVVHNSVYYRHVSTSQTLHGIEKLYLILKSKLGTRNDLMKDKMDHFLVDVPL